MMMWFAGMAAAALVTNTSSPEPRNSALLNFMKGLAVQFMSLPAEDTSVQRQRKHCSTTSDEITQNKKFYPWQHFFLSLYSEMQTQDTVLDCSYKRGKETCQKTSLSSFTFKETLNFSSFNKNIITCFPRSRVMTSVVGFVNNINVAMRLLFHFCNPDDVIVF